MLGAQYQDAGVNAWTVWSYAHAYSVAEALQRAGHRLDASPSVMVALLSDLPPIPETPPAWRCEWHPRLLAMINEYAYGMPEGDFTNALAQMSPANHLRMYFADVDGETVSGLITCTTGTTSGIYLVATVPHARGHGTAAAILRIALMEAANSGCTETVLQATGMARPIYQALGYRSVAEIQLWEYLAS